MKIEEMAFAELEELKEIRHSIHRAPELGKTEFKTSALIREKLSALKIPHKTVYNTGVVGYIYGGQPGKTVLLRADIDALPIEEKSGVEFASETDGVMHACGHDVHTACLLGAAKILNEIKDELCGNVILVFQPDEETDGGALPMINAGIMNDPKADAAFALHVEPLEETGNIQIKNGSIMASPDDFEIKITGIGGHGAYPEKCVNPIAIGAELVREIQNRIENNPDKQIVSICSFNGGNCRNAIPDSVTLTGTARSLDNETRRRLEETLNEICGAVGEKFGGSAVLDFNKLFPPVVNSPEMNEIVKAVANRLDCIKNIVTLERASMAGDDFAYYAERVPGAYFKLGVGNKAIDAVYPIHSPKFRADDNALPIGTAMLAGIAVEYLTEYNTDCNAEYNADCNAEYNTDCNAEYNTDCNAEYKTK